MICSVPRHNLIFRPCSRIGVGALLAVIGILSLGHAMPDCTAQRQRVQLARAVA
jgi:hypothetical protein